MKRLILLLFLFTGTVHAAPHLTRNYAYRYFTTRDGLAQMQLLCAFQDKDGYMWFGTKGGVSRWDGVSFKNYTMDEGFPNGNVLSIHQWNEAIVAITFRNLIFIYPDQSLKVIPIPEPYRIDNGSVSVIDQNRLLIYTIMNPNQKVEGCYIYDKRRGTLKLNTAFREEVCCEQNDSIITKTGIYKRKNLHFTKTLSYPLFADGGVVLDQKNKRLYLKQLTSGWLYLFSYQNNELTPVWKKHVLNPMVYSYITDKTLINGGCPLKTDPETNIQFGNNLSQLAFTFTDRENNLWIGTDNGLYNFYGLNIVEYRFNIGNPDNIWSIVEDDNRMFWFGSFGNGLWRLSPDDQLKIVLPKHREWENQYMGSTKAPGGNIYMTYGRGIAHFQNYKLIEKTNIYPSLFAYYDITTQQLFYSGVDSASCLRGLYVNIGRKQRFYPWTAGYPTTILRDMKGRIRIGGFHGQAILARDTILTDQRKHDYEGVICMALDKQGRLWKGTERGLYIEMPDGTEHRVGGNRLKGAVSSIAIWRNKYLVAGCDRSILLLDIYQNKRWKDFDFTEIGYDSGFTGLESGQNGICIDRNGDVWLTTALCVLKFNPEKLVRWKTRIIPSLRVSSVSLSKDNSIWKQLIFTTNQSMLLDHNNNFIRFEYIANSISSPKSLRFRYRLKGFSDVWSDTVFTKTAAFSNVGYGTFRFEVQCSLDGEHWSPVAASPDLNIPKPFYISSVAIVLYILIFTLIIITITKSVMLYRQKKVLDRINHQKLSNELQLKTLRSKIIPHFTGNVLSAIGYLAMTDKLKAGHYISVFAKFSKLTLINADKNYISLTEEMNYIEHYLLLEKLRFEDKFEYQIHIDKLLNKDIKIPSMLLHTYCDNAIRHGLVNKEGKGLLVISITQTPQAVTITITDNGIGRKRAKEMGTQGNGQGLSLINAQICFYNEINAQKITQKIIDMTDDEGNAIGTQIRLIVPLVYAYERTKNNI